MGAPLFILSFRHRDELNRLATGAGWRPIAARRDANATSRFVGSGAAVAVVDARGALEEGRRAVQALADAAETNAAALLVLLSRTDSEALDDMYRLGATHFLISPFTEPQLLHALQFAKRHAERSGGRFRRESRDKEESVSWRWRQGSRTVELSPALARMAGLGEEREGRIGLAELFSKLDRAGRRAARDAVERVMSGGEATAFAHADKAGTARIVHHVREDAGSRDIVGRTESIVSEAEGESASRDPLTGLRDGLAARAWIAERLSQAEREESPLVAILVSVSRYDAINAAFGRPSGDAVLQAVARRIERHLEGKGQLAARMAGAEFAVLLGPPADLDEARRIADALVEAIAKPFMSGDQVITLASRAGIAAAKGGDDPGSLLRRASAALAQAKEADSAPIRILDDGRETAFAKDELEVDLRRALAADEIDVRFQPQVSIIGGAVVGAEALARWRHPRYGELGAATLFSVAERSDYLAQLSDHVQRKAIAIAAAWPEPLREMRLSVNITAADILRPNFAAQLLELVKDSGFEPARLTVEMTEGGLIDDLAAAANLLAQLRGGGLRVAIDDFGTGYSSLAYLKALPLDYLKLDKRLSQDIAGSVRDRIVVRGVIDMARSLGLTVIAEGVETEEQLGLLAQEGCNLYQGFLCAQPGSSEDLVDLVMNGR